MILKIPLAWLQLAHQKVRFLVTLSGIAFIVILLFVQLGVQDALYTSATYLHQNLRGDLFLISSQYNSLTSQHSFPRPRLYQALGFQGVESVIPLYLQFAKLKNPIDGRKFPIYVIAFDPGKPILNLAEFNQSLQSIQLPDVVLFDRLSRFEFGPIAEKFEQGKLVIIEIFGYNKSIGYRVKVGGLFTQGPSFGVDGNLIMSYSTFLRTFQERRAGEIDIGLVILKPGADIQQVSANLSAYLPKDVKIFNRQEFITFEKDFWSRRTPIGFVFSLMVTMGFAIGIAVVYQILYSNISNHLAEYATLKAIGFKNNYLLGVVFQQSLVLAFLGYIPGFAITLEIYNLANNVTNLPVFMSVNKALIVLIATILMCSISGLFAMNKLRAADPADIF
ncbi:MAG: FtsX-like permease family protein [Chlorogloeopsis fritschii C42_A2020_084]|uniref:ABC transporter permease DevC n=1 Tax=Chlorogloeopsis fritschii TaxID=1124 RepID=UPI0019F033E2|nr:ABC transporter permease DevC [Chlorogloeopsis fritschii]MBF2008964.1 FtsX-like permease family protein [Chlorogloeopsis fritschii C42_A2020_084]